MKTTPSVLPDTDSKELSFKYLPGYAAYIRDYQLHEYVTTLLAVAKASGMPLLRFFESYSEEEMNGLSKNSSHEFLTELAENRAAAQIQRSVENWKSNRLSVVGQQQITSRDVTLISYIKRKTLTNLLPLYTTDFLEGVMILNELDDYFKEADVALTATYISLLEDNLKLKEEQLLNAQTIAGVGSFSWNLNTQEADLTSELRKILDVEKGKGVQEFFQKIHPEDVENFKAAVHDALENSKILDVEYRYIAHGKERVLWSRGNVYRNENTTLLKGTVMDVTERHQMLRRLQENELLFKQAQERAHIGNFLWNLRNNEVFWSDELYHIYEMSPAGQPMTFQKYTEMLKPAERELLLEAIAQASATQKPIDLNFTVMLPSGREKILNIKAELKTKENTPYQCVGTIQDITEKQKLINQLQESDALYKQAQARTHIGNWKWDLKTDKITWSDEMYKIYGIAIDAELSFGNYLKRIHPDYLADNKKHIEHTLATHEPAEHIYRIVRPNGEERILQSKLLVITDEYNKPIEMTGTCQDITDMQLLIEKLQKSEEELQRKNRELELSNSNLQEFAYVASHDLKAPLRKIATFGEMLFQFTDDKLTDKAKYYVEKMMDGSKRMQNMIDELLAFAVISSNKSFEVTSLKTVLDKTLNDLELSIREKKAVIHCSELPEAAVVSSQFEQLFMNLINNSLKFSREGVSPVITITHNFLNAEEIKANGLFPNSKYLRISFQDNGIGFEKEYTQKIFGMFQRLHGKVDYEGSGIGLSICKKIVENHGGIIAAEGIPGEGARFDVIIPLN